LKIVFDHNDLTFRLYYGTNIEREQAFSSFNRKIKDWRFKIKYHPGWKGDVQFISNLDKLPAGLWGQLKAMCETYKFPLKVEKFNEYLRNDVDYQHVKRHCEMIIEERNKHYPADKQIQLRPYQPKAVYLSLKYRLCMNDLSTAAGKTLIMFMYASYVHQYINKDAQILSIEPDPDYVIQTYTEVMEFATKSKSTLRVGMVSGSSSLKDISEYDFVIGNFQTLANRPKEFYEKVNFILVDEGHRAKATSIKSIMKLCVNAKDRVGLSGTVLDDKSADHYEILAATGPTVIKVTKRDMMDAGYAPNVRIKIYVLDYLSQEERKNIAFMKLSQIKTEIDQYNHEMFLMRNSQVRMQWVAQLVASLPKNSLTFFTDVQNEFGKRLMSTIRQISSKELYYIDGDVKDSMRDIYKKRMEEGNNKGMIATYGTYSTGKSIKNLHYLVGAEPVKSDTIIGQVIGRGMRESDEKEEFHWIDIVDDFTWEGLMNNEEVYFTNILFRQSRERIKLYKKEKFQYEIIRVKLDKTQFQI